MLLFNLKLAVWAALIFAAFRWLNVEPVAFAIGLSVMPLAIVIVAVQQPFARSRGGSDHEETHG